MKQPKRLSREQKACLVAQGYNPKDYMFVCDLNDSYFKVVNKTTGIQKTVDKYRKAKGRYDFKK